MRTPRASGRPSGANLGCPELDAEFLQSRAQSRGDAAALVTDDQRGGGEEPAGPFAERFEFVDMVLVRTGFTGEDVQAVTVQNDHIEFVLFFDGMLVLAQRHAAGILPSRVERKKTLRGR